MSRILVIEDDPAILRGLADSPRPESYEVLTAVDGASGCPMAIEKCPDPLILDLMLPKLSGCEVCRQMRAKGLATPILMLAARGEEGDRVPWLDLCHLGRRQVGGIRLEREGALLKFTMSPLILIWLFQLPRKGF